MAAASGYLVFFLLLAVVACKVADAADGEALSVVIGQAKCTDCTRKNMKAEAVFKDLQVVIKCNNSHGEFEHTAVGSMDSSGAFSIPLATDVVQGADCFAQLNSAEGTPCYGQEPSWIHPFSKSTYVAYAGKVHSASAAFPEPQAALLQPFPQWRIAVTGASELNLASCSSHFCSVVIHALPR